jgi:hypothetical protein
MCFIMNWLLSWIVNDICFHKAELSYFHYPLKNNPNIDKFFSRLPFLSCFFFC